MHKVEAEHDNAEASEAALMHCRRTGLDTCVRRLFIWPQLLMINHVLVKHRAPLAGLCIVVLGLPLYAYYARAYA